MPAPLAAHVAAARTEGDLQMAAADRQASVQSPLSSLSKKRCVQDEYHSPGSPDAPAAVRAPRASPVKPLALGAEEAIEAHMAVAGAMPKRVRTRLAAISEPTAEQQDAKNDGAAAVSGDSTTAPSGSRTFEDVVFQFEVQHSMDWEDELIMKLAAMLVEAQQAGISEESIAAASLCISDARGLKIDLLSKEVAAAFPLRVRLGASPTGSSCVAAGGLPVAVSPTKLRKEFVRNILGKPLRFGDPVSLSRLEELYEILQLDDDSAREVLFVPTKSTPAGGASCAPSLATRSRLASADVQMRSVPPVVIAASTSSSRPGGCLGGS
eukprot:TRINITY_DN40776_c0_g1_i1.p1 TRINITY_DN40776_c0_g1~~TRINITY_DN40776_c0_g1_i1.p1  ORF type:complete len:324 (-),score=73.21 TRINITY_DN40776_c0_g1_i1:194-1165(-)